MIVRFRGKEGAFRVQANENDSFASVIEQLKHQLPPHNQELAVANGPNAVAESRQPQWETPLAQLGIKHGDLFFISNVGSSTATAKPLTDGDELDVLLASKTGRITREQTSLCTHGAKGMCEYCQPLEPWDEEYRHLKGIKHVSIHAWRKKVAEEGGYLERPQYSVDLSCTNGHAPWPRGFCSKCQPPAITLQLQRFRMVDHVEFKSPKIIEQFIEFWRQTNTQRIGFLIGKYSAYDVVPLGIKAEVHAIWEPQQLNDVDSLLVQQLPTENALKAANLLGLDVIGVIFTDLLDSGAGDGKVVTKRHLNSYFLSSLEVLFAARMQNQFPHLYKNEQFSSRFVTCCVSGNEFGDVDVACYQASVQGEEMARADLIVPSTNPSVMRIQPQNQSRYVPDIFYKRVNEYKLTVQEDAKPAFPVDYLLISLSHGFKNAEIANRSFTIENRPQMMGQTPSQVVDALNLSHGLTTDKLADFHLVLYLLELGVLQPDEEKMLSEIVKLLGTESENLVDLAGHLGSGPGFNTLRMLAN